MVSLAKSEKEKFKKTIRRDKIPIKAIPDGQAKLIFDDIKSDTNFVEEPLLNNVRVQSMKLSLENQVNSEILLFYYILLGIILIDMVVVTSYCCSYYQA